MIRRKNRQTSFFELKLWGGPDVEAMMPPELRRVDAILEDDELLDTVEGAMAKRSGRSRSFGRPGTPVEVALRILVLKHLRNWSYEQLEWEVRGNLVYRCFCRIGDGEVPDSKTMVRLGQLIDAEVLEAVFARIVQRGVEKKVSRGRKMRVDTTVVETPIRHPLDSQLCDDIHRTLQREVERVRSEGVAARRPFRNRKRSIRRAVDRIRFAGRKPMSRQRRQQALKAPYGKLLGITRSVMRDAERVMKAAKRTTRTLSARALRAVEVIKRTLALATVVVTQSKARIFKGITNSREKIVSIFEPHTQILRRGKVHKPTEFGRIVQVQEADGGLITNIGVTDEHDTRLLVPAIDKHRQVFGAVPHTIATDRGFFSFANVEAAEASGVRCVAIPKPGFKSAAQRAKERKRAFRKARAWRSGSEARIAHLKHDFGMHRSRYRGPSGVHRAALWAGIASNLTIIARATT